MFGGVEDPACHALFEDPLSPDTLYWTEQDDTFQRANGDYSESVNLNTDHLASQGMIVVGQPNTETLHVRSWMPFRQYLVLTNAYMNVDTVPGSDPIVVRPSLASHGVSARQLPYHPEP